MRLLMIARTNKLVPRLSKKTLFFQSFAHDMRGCDDVESIGYNATIVGVDDCCVE